MSKRSKIVLILLLLFLTLSFPVIVSDLIVLSTYILKIFNISPVVFIEYPFQMSINEYISTIIALLSCFSAALIAFGAFKLSQTIELRNTEEEKNIKKARLELLISQIAYDKAIIDNFNKKTNNNIDLLINIDINKLLEIRGLVEELIFKKIIKISIVIKSIKEDLKLTSVTDEYCKNCIKNMENLIEELNTIKEEI